MPVGNNQKPMPRVLYTISTQGQYWSDLQLLSTEIEAAVTIFHTAEEMNRLALEDASIFRALNRESPAIHRDHLVAAIERAKTEKFDAAICDIMMPGVNGVAALGQLKRLQPNLKVIMATAYATSALAAASMKGGATGYIAKPYDLKELFAMLDLALGKGP